MPKKLDRAFQGVNLKWLALLPLFAASCGSSPTPVAPGNAPAYRMTLGDTRRALFENEVIPVAPKVEWDVNSGSGMRGTLLLIDSTVLAATTNQQMLAFHRRTGRKHWDQRFNNGVTATALYDRNTVYVATDEYDGALFALNTARGRRQWKRTVGSVRFTPLLDNNIVFLGTDGGVITALRTENGTTVWRAGLRSPIVESPLDLGDRIAVFTGADTVYALKKSDATMTAHAVISSTPSAPPSVAGNTIIVPMQDSTIVGLDAVTLGEKWHARTSSPVLTAPVVAANGDAYAAARDGTLYRIRNGELTQIVNVGHAISPSLTLARGHLLLGSYDGTLLAVTTEGAVVWQHKFDDSIVAPVAVGDQSIYVPLLRGRIIKLSDEGGIN
jgi:outer membrane protein assembly factor BamB